MADGAENLVLAHLRALREDVGLLREGVQELTGRVSAVENGVAGIRHDIANLTEQTAMLNAGMDRFDQRLARVGRRLELIPADNMGQH
jgi:hypothetical protein